jgi:hypothetical protein
MGISLNGLTPAGTYPGLIKTGDNTAISGTPKVLSDGNGNNLPMEVSTTGVNLTGSPTVNSVAIANTTQLATKQDTLVSGTNIKTINGTSVLGSGNIVTPSTNPSGVSGAIQFSDGSAFASDAANFFWNNTTKRLGIGTNAPTRQVEFVGSAATPSVLALRYGTATGGGPFIELDALAAAGGRNYLIVSTTNSNGTVGAGGLGIFDGTEYRFVIKGGNVGIGENSPTSRLQIKGSGSTSATTSLLVQNSAGTAAVTVRDNLETTFGGTIRGANLVMSANVEFQNILYGSNFFSQNTGATTLGAQSAADASAMLDIRSTTRGFLPPRMTTTQKNAITAVAGLVVYDSTTNKLCCYNGSTWNDLF